VGKIAQLLAIITPVRRNFAYPTLISNVEHPAAHADAVPGFLACRAA
jgi:hypothetical protein